jgi:hypothetical protein
MSDLIELAKRALAEARAEGARQEAEHRAALERHATDLMRRVVDDRLRSQVRDPEDGFPEPVLGSFVDLEGGDYECRFTLGGLPFLARSTDDVRRLYLFYRGTHEIFSLAQLGGVMEMLGIA